MLKVEKLKKKIEDILEEYNFETDDGEGWILDTEEMADDLIAAGIGDVEEAEHRAKVAEKAFLILWNECKEKLGWDIDCTMWYKKQAEKELEEEKER